MLCKMGTRKRLRKLREALASEDTNPHKKTKYACIVEAHESTRTRLESTLPRNHEDHIAEKGFNSINHYKLVHKIIPLRQLDELKSKKDVILESQKEKGKSTLLHLWTFVTSRMPSWNHSTRSTKDES